MSLDYPSSPRSTRLEHYQPEQQWCGRRVKAYDGTTVLMSDTPANQAVYPQHSNQKEGCGFPLAKLVVWFCGTCCIHLKSAPYSRQFRHPSHTYHRQG